MSTFVEESALVEGKVVGRGDRKTVRWKKDRRRRKLAREQRKAEARGAPRRS